VRAFPEPANLQCIEPFRNAYGCFRFLIRDGPSTDNSPVANLGANLWEHSEESKTASIRAGRIHYTAQCQSKHGCRHLAAIQIECRDSIGHPFWNRDYSEAHAKPIIEKAKRLNIPVSWP
jgi:hypothetical protein